MPLMNPYADHGRRHGDRDNIDLPRVCADIRDRFPVSGAARLVGVKLVRAGRELKGCCPFHPDRSPSFTIYADDRRFQCFGGGCGAEGDVLDFVRRAYGVSLLGAIEMLDGGVLRDVEQQRAPVEHRERDNRFALSIWRSATAIEGTPGEAYLRRRAITMPLPSSLRFARLKAPKDSGVAAAGGVGLLPCLVALVSSVTGEPVGIQRTFLNEDGSKATSTDRKVKFSLGRVRGGAVRLGPDGLSDLALCEGVEDALSLMELGAPVAWAAAGAGMLHHMEIPAAVMDVVIGGDADHAGRRAAQRAAAVFTEQGRRVRVIYPTAPHKDFNAELLANLTEAA